ncbi:MAG: deoxyguanosinetriphosphate triphosphohydrolase [Rubrivivax sp.]|nr:deoxyguanosinetriphosphate triphosphohydrolase [Rubrivivax sp.]
MNGALAPWACDPRRSRGRRIAQPPAPPRNEHQRDRDRIVHSTAFRRLVYKTQVFINHEGDLFRTRLTHSLEVAQLGRSVARALRLNEDLVEAIALAHDLGHTPFGHAGQDALHECMREHGGFEHNLQSLRVVDRLEVRYPAFDGLNLTFETREGVLKHCSRRNAERLAAAEPAGPAQRFLDGTQPSLEAQVVNLADEMAYHAHDIDDGVRSGLLTMAQLDEVPLFVHWRDAVLADHPQLATQPGRRLLFETLRRMLSAQIADLVRHTGEAVAQHAPTDADAVRALPALARFGEPLRAQVTQLKRFLFAALYRHPQVVQTTALGRQVVAELFAAYSAAPQEMPDDFAGAEDRPRAVADYIAGMTDRFALREHHRLTGRRLFDGA